MYQVSADYLAAIKQPAIRSRVVGTIAGSPFTDENILSGSFSITNQNSGNDNVQIGTVYIGELSITLRNMSFGRYTMDGMEIVPTFELLLADGVTWEPVPLGKYYVGEANHTAAGVVIKAYDAMSKFDKSFSEQQTVGKAYELAALACEQCGVPFGMEEADVQALPNGNIDISVYSENDIETWRDFLSWLAQTLGCFATIDRHGQLVFRSYGGDTVDTIDDSHRFTGASFSDYEVRYTGMSVMDMKTQMTNYYSVTPDDGLTYSLGSNPFLQYGTEEMYNARRQAVLDALQGIKFVPFSVTMPENPAYDLGDVLSFPGGLGDADKHFCVNKYTWTYHKGTKLEGVGKNPALGSAKSKSDKNITGLLSNVKSDELTTYGYINADSIPLGENEWTAVINLEFATVNPKAKIDVWSEIKLDVKLAEGSDRVVCDVKYFLSEEEQVYHPAETWNEDGLHLLGLHYFIGDVADNTRYQWIVLLKLSGGSGTIASGDVHALISGQGMAGEGGGNYKSITVSEVFPGYMLAAQSVEIGHFFTDVSVSAPPARPQGIDQMFRGIELRHGLLGLSDFQADLVVVTGKPAAASENTTD